MAKKNRTASSQVPVNRYAPKLTVKTAVQTFGGQLYLSTKKTDGRIRRERNDSNLTHEALDKNRDASALKKPIEI